MTVADLKSLLEGNEIVAKNGSICIDLECNKFLAITKYDDSLNLHDTLEEALQELELSL